MLYALTKPEDALWELGCVKAKAMKSSPIYQVCALLGKLGKHASHEEGHASHATRAFQVFALQHQPC